MFQLFKHCMFTQFRLCQSGQNTRTLLFAIARESPLHHSSVNEKSDAVAFAQEVLGQ